jgi:hypothetical protein
LHWNDDDSELSGKCGFTTLNPAAGVKKKSTNETCPVELWPRFPRALPGNIVAIVQGFRFEELRLVTISKRMLEHERVSSFLKVCEFVNE